MITLTPTYLYKQLIPVFCLIFYSFFSFNKIYTQELRPGDIAVLGVSANMFQCNGVSGGDEISFVCFKDIQTGTSLDVTDNGWERCYPNRWADREGVLRFTRTGAMIPAGTIITWQLTNTGGWGSYSFISPDSNWLVENINTSVALPTPLNLNAGGDQLWFLFDGAWENSQFPSDNQAEYLGGTVLFGLNTKSTWSPICTGPTATQNSALHPQAAACNSIVQTASSDYAKYTGDLSPTDQLSWINRIHNNANWTRYSSCQAYLQAAPNLNAIDLTIQTIPAQLLVQNSHICKGDSMEIEIMLPTYGGPFDVDLDVNSMIFSLSSINDGHSLVFIPDSNLFLSISSISDALGCTTSGNDTQTIEIQVHSTATSYMESLSCEPRDSISTKYYSQYGCDSLCIEFFKTAPTPLAILSIDSSNYNGFAISCHNGEDGNLNITTIGGFQPIKTEWSDGFQGTSRSNLSEGQLSFSIMDSILCTISETVELHAPEPIRSDFFVTKTTCKGSQDASIKVKSISGGTSPYLFNINQNGFSLDTHWTNLSSQISELIVQDVNGCEDSTILKIESGNHVDTLVIVDTLLHGGQIFKYIFPFSIDSFEVFDFPEKVIFEAPNTVIFDTESGALFSGYIFLKNACPSLFSVRIRIDDNIQFYAPNVFQINPQHGIKSNFSLDFNRNQVQNIRLFRIYDRFGALIFEEKGFQIHQGWDGKINNKNAQTGVYLWEATLLLWNGELKHISGDLLLIP